ncbi:DNA-binding transcriptional activator FeaR [compost metagenome]
MPITSIGYEAGFKDPSYFARAFKQVSNCTPSEYRQARQLGAPANENGLLKDSDAAVTDGLLQGAGAHKYR